MKKLLLSFFAVFVSLSIWGQEIPVNIYSDPPENPGNPHRGTTSLPTVTYEDNDVYVYAPYAIESMEVIIYDATGEVIYTYTSAMVLGRNIIILPPSVSENKFCIMLNFNGYHLLGYFLII